ncbi:MAG: BadF/BadG/BcrA/BcrD ATPase family protein, partial [Halieaceae bacterium]|nr:BadF/BadG/BcrA/BcrD ATPase family protein [Halieaceae bacterium]
MDNALDIGLDVGSTTVKAVVMPCDSHAVLWSDYRRHHTRQAECALAILQDIRAAFDEVAEARFAVYITGSGAGPLIPLLAAHFVQEVNAVAASVDALHPDVYSVVELGGQDAKIIHFRDNPGGQRKVVTSMNDKCASGTGATIDKCMLKVGLTPEQTAAIPFAGDNLHPVAAKCGVFAETDIVNLVKAGVPAAEIMCSLANAIVSQNLSVLARGSTLRERVLLLGGPNSYLRFLRECWQQRIPESWEERGYAPDGNLPGDDLVYVPEHAALYAAMGAVLFGRADIERPVYAGETLLKAWLREGRKAQLSAVAGPPLLERSSGITAPGRHHDTGVLQPRASTAGIRLRGYLGIDGGSTSSKCVLVDDHGALLAKVYRLSKGNPIEDMREMLAEMQAACDEQDVRLEVAGLGVTGYAAEVLAAALEADASIVETVAHLQSALQVFPQVDVVCDIGGQDIKVLIVQNGELKDFRLSNQCSAGNGMLLQAMAEQFGVPVEEFAEHAFAAELSPDFSYGCAVFLDSDRVNFQKEGYNKQELMAGLARVLPRNVWQYVVQIPRLAELGQNYLLQGGTQYNRAAVQAQVDYILERVPEAEVRVHPYPGEAGAHGAAMAAVEAVKARGGSRFIGVQAALALRYTTRSDATTTCHFCPNQCARTFVDVEKPAGGTTRYISGFSCEQGTVEDKEALQALRQARESMRQRFPNLVRDEAALCFRSHYRPEPWPTDSPVTGSRLDQWLRRLGRRPVAFSRSGKSAALRRRTLRIGMPRVLNMWSTAPFWRAYLETVGIPARQILFSDETSETLFSRGARYGATDPCFPSKVVQAHIHNLLFEKNRPARPIDYLFFPCITHVPTFLDNVMDTACCPVVAGTPNVVKAAFTKETDYFSRAGVEYLDPAMTMNEPALLNQQLYDCWGERLGLTRDESDFAAAQGWAALRDFNAAMEARGARVLDYLQRTASVGILLLGRPYHHDPGINHEITEEFQALGYPVLTIRSIPKDRGWLSQWFEDSPLDITDVWPENYSANTAQKVWAAKFAARHPNIAILDISSFKCGNDAPVYGLIDSIAGTAGAPYAALHDIDANRPAGSLKIRVATYAETLRRRQEALRAGVFNSSGFEPL